MVRLKVLIPVLSQLQEPLKMLLSSSSVAIYGACSPSLRVVWFPSGTPMRETRFSFPSDYRLEIASGLVMDECVHLSFQL